MKIKEAVKDIVFIIVIIVLVVFLLITQVYTKREKERTVGFHIKGGVNEPGYYELLNGKRLVDAVKSAGGATENADLDAVNLAQIVLDGEEIIIPKKGEISKHNSADSGENDGYYKDEGIFEDSEERSFSENIPININTADMYLLCQLDGIGESTAQKIMNYRTANGGFKSIEEIKKVDGIGNSKFEKIKDMICI